MGIGNILDKVKLLCNDVEIVCSIEKVDTATHYDKVKLMMMMFCLSA